MKELVWNYDDKCHYLQQEILDIATIVVKAGFIVFNLLALPFRLHSIFIYRFVIVPLSKPEISSTIHVSKKVQLVNIAF